MRIALSATGRVRGTPWWADAWPVPPGRGWLAPDQVVSLSVRPHSARKPRCHFLEQPTIAVRVVEGRVGEVGAALGVGAGLDAGLGAVEERADVDAAAEKVVASRLDVVDDQFET